MTNAIFYNGQGILVSTFGPGTVHLLSYASNAKLPSVIGSTTTDRDGITRFMISHSYTFDKFAFYWEGSGEAFCGVGEGMARQPVGNSWKAATYTAWGDNTLTTQDVETSTTSAVNVGHLVTCFIIPDTLS